MTYGKLIHRDLSGPDGVWPTGNPHEGFQKDRAPKAPAQIGHRQVKKHPGRKTGHSAPVIQTLAAHGETHHGPAAHGASRQTGPSAPGLAVHTFGAQTVKTHGQANLDGSHKDKVGKGLTHHSAPVERHRNRDGQPGGMESTRPQSMSYGLSGHMAGHQGRSTPVSTKIVHKKIGSRRQRDNY